MKKRLVFTGEYTSMWIDETQELKDELYEILLEDFIKCGELHFKESGTIDEKQMIDYLKKEFHYTGEYTLLRDKIVEVIKQRKE